MMILCITLNPVVDTTMFIAEAGDVFRTEANRITHITGGKGTNVSRALRTFDVTSQLFIALGGKMGRFAADLLAEEGLSVRIGWVSGETRLMVTVVDRENRQQAFFAPNDPFTSGDRDVLQRTFAQLPTGITAVCVCGSSPGALADCLFKQLLCRAAELDVPTLLDSSGSGLKAGMAASPTIVKVNLAEAEGLLGRPLESEQVRLNALDELRSGGVHWAILTLGPEGALMACGSKYWRVHSPQLVPVNPIGSGDAMTAGLLAGLQRDLPPEECMRLGTAFAAANVLSWDACHLDLGDVDRLLPLVELEAL